MTTEVQQGHFNCLATKDSDQPDLCCLIISLQFWVLLLLEKQLGKDTKIHYKKKTLLCLTGP